MTTPTTSAPTQRARAMADLRTVLELLAEQVPTRAHHLRWIATEYTAADRDDLLPPAATLEELLAPPAVLTFIMAAEHGLLRTAPTARTTLGQPHPSSPATNYQRRLLLRELVAVVAQPFPQLPDTNFCAPQPDITSAQIAHLRRMLEYHSLLTDLQRGYDDWQRHLAMVSMVLDTHASSGDLQRMRRQDLSADHSHISVHRKPPGRYSAPSMTHHALSHTTVILLDNWLAVRARLMTAVRGGRDALWVSLVPSGNGTVLDDPEHYVRPPGITLQATGLHRAWRRNTLGLNVLMHAEPGWEPLPYRCGNLARAIRPGTA